MPDPLQTVAAPERANPRRRCIRGCRAWGTRRVNLMLVNPSPQEPVAGKMHLVLSLTRECAHESHAARLGKAFARVPRRRACAEVCRRASGAERSALDREEAGLDADDWLPTRRPELGSQDRHRHAERAVAVRHQQRVANAQFLLERTGEAANLTYRPGAR